MPTKAQEPWLNIKPDKDTKAYFSEQLAKKNTPSGPVLKRFGKLLQTGTNEELMAVFSSHIVKKQGWRRFLGEQLWEQVAKRAERHALELDGRWSHLMDELMNCFPEIWSNQKARVQAKRELEARTKEVWTEWISEQGTEPDFDQTINIIFEYQTHWFIVWLVREAPVVTPYLISRVFRGKNLRGLGEELWRRTDIEPENFQEAIRDNLHAWSHHKVEPHWVQLALKKPGRQWDTFNVELLEAATIVLQQDSVRNRAVISQMVGQMRGTNDEALVQAIIKSPIQPLFVSLVRQLSPARVRSILEAGAHSELREAVANQPKLLADPAIRELLEKNGRSRRIWEKLLISSTDKDEAGRLLGYLMRGHKGYLVGYLKQHQLPLGTVVPKEVLAGVLSQGSKENRLVVIKALPSLTPSGAPAPALPPKLMPRRTKR